MGLFSKAEVIILKGTSDADTYLKNLEELLPRATGEIKDKIQKEIAITKAGIVGEENILFELKNSDMDMVVLRDIYLETKDGLGAQIDFIVVTSKVFFVIECKNLFGNIEIDAKGNFIRTMEYGGRKNKEGIYSPITQNERHMAVLKECKAEDRNMLVAAMIRKSFDLYHKSLVVLANPKTVVNDKYAKKNIKEQVLRADQLIKVIRKMVLDSKEVASSKKDMVIMAEGLLAKNKNDRKDYFKKFEELVKEYEMVSEDVVQTADKGIVETKSEEQVIVETVNTSVKEEQTVVESVDTSDKEDQAAIESNDNLLCPKCGSALVLRTAKKGNNVGEQFYGCSGFPKCRFILKMEE